MKKKLKDNQNKIIYSVIALACFLIVTGLAVMLQSRDNQKQQYAMVILGDSIVGQHRNETSVPAQIGVLLGQAVYNGAMGGTCMSCMDEDKRVAYTKDSLSVVSLAEAIATEDFGTQQTARIRESGTEHFVQVIDELEAVDYDTVDTILLCAGINDYHAGITIYPEKDLYDEYTFTGALRSAVRDIQEAYPDIRVVLVTPTYTWYQENVKPQPETEGKKGYVCKVCGWIYEGDTLPEDIVCPLCKHGAADFEPIA